LEEGESVECGDIDAEHEESGSDVEEDIVREKRTRRDSSASLPIPLSISTQFYTYTIEQFYSRPIA